MKIADISSFFSPEGKQRGRVNGSADKFCFSFPGAREKALSVAAPKVPEEPARTLTFGPQKPRHPQQGPSQAKTVTFNPQPPLAHEQSAYVPVHARQQPPPSAMSGGGSPYGTGTSPVISRVAANQMLNSHQPVSSAGLSKVPMHQMHHSASPGGQGPQPPRLNTFSPVAGGVRVLPPHGRLPQVNIPNRSSDGGYPNSNGEDSNSDRDLVSDGYIVYGSSADQGQVRTSNV